MKNRFTNAEITGFLAFLIAGAFLFIDIKFFILTLAGFIIFCFLAVFFTRYSIFLPIISKGKSGKKAIALTFDDSPDPLSTPKLLFILLKHNVKATFFVIGKKALNHPDLIKSILSDGHTIGNHSYNHDPFLMMKSSKTINKEIESTQEILGKLGITPLTFRPPVGITNPKLYQILLKANLYTVNFSCHGIDYGNRRVKNLSKKVLEKVHSDDIVMLHDLAPFDKGQTSYWLNEVESILLGIKNKGFMILPLSEIIGKSVMISNDPQWNSSISD